MKAEADKLLAVDLIKLSLGIENKIDSQGDLMPLPGRDSTLFAISRHQTGYCVFFRHDIPQDVRRNIGSIGPENALNDHETVRKILAKHIPCDNVFAGKGYYFKLTPTPKEFPDVLTQEGCFVVLVDGCPIATAWTAEESEYAAELAVETDPGYRQCGYARQVVSAWAKYTIDRGKVAFFSHLTDNVASEALAHSLGVVQYDVRTTYEYMSSVE